MVFRVAYHRDMHTLPKEELLSNIALGLPDCFILGTIYILAIINTHLLDRHIRYMIGTSSMMLGTGVGRWISGFSDLPGDDGANLS